MKRFLKKLFRDFMTSSKTRGSKPASRRAVLQLNGLEDRMVLSSAFKFGSTLFVNFTPGDNLELVEVNPGVNRQIEVVHGGTIIGEFSINSINDVEITVAGQDDLVINDSDGMPFATGTTISLHGAGSNNTMVLNGTRAFDTNENYSVGAMASSFTTLGVDGLNFRIFSAVDEVLDTIPITGGPLDVTTSGQNVELSSQVNSFQELSNLGPGGGGNFIFDVQNFVELNELAADATVNVNAPGAAGVDKGISVVTHALGDTVIIAADSVPTSVQTIGTDSEVVLQANTAPVTVVGNQGSTVIIGQNQPNGTDSTKGIQANVLVEDMRTLIVSDTGNVSTQENVTVTEKNISGTGLFGNNAAVVSYSDVSSVDLFSGQLADTYTVKGSSSTAEFGNRINIFDDSNKLFDAKVDLDSHSHLNLGLDKLSTLGVADLFIDAPGGKFSNLSGGVIDVSFPGGLPSQIDNNGFTVKEEHV
jgi:hypothetical protein